MQIKPFLLIASLCLGFTFLSAQENQDAAKKNSDIIAEYQYGVSGFEKGKQYVITRYDGVEHIGEILSDDGREILIDTRTLGIVYIPKYEIKNIIEVVDEKSIMYNEYQATGPFTTRYSFTNNALPIKKGENYGMLNLYGPEAHLALSDRLNVGIMATWIASPVVLVGKYSLGTGKSKANLSLGTMLGTSGYLNNFQGYGGLHWLTLTLGDRKNNFTISGGYAYLQTGIRRAPEGTYVGDEYINAEENNATLLKMTQGPIVSIAGIFRIGAKSSFVFDSMLGYFSFQQTSDDAEFNDIISDYVHTVTRNNAHLIALFLMPGVRFQSSDRKAFQICIAGVSTIGEINTSFPIPMCSWFYRF